MAVESPVIAKLREKFSASIVETHSFRGDDTALVLREQVVDILTFLRQDPEMAFEFLMDVTAVDYLGREPRFEVVYHLYSFSKNQRVRIKTGVPEADPVVDTASTIWRGADWFEREIYDMYGIRFAGHPDLRRILLYEEFEGHPLRKDYPIDLRQPTVATREFPDPEKQVRRNIDEWRGKK
jgi:NADH-quinone oxidoreductase subunit C